MRKSIFERTKALQITAVVAAITMLSCLAIALAGCSVSVPSNASSTRTVTDAIGRTVELPETVKSAAIDGYATRMVVYAGAADKLVGVSDMDKKDAVGMPYQYANKEAFSKLPSTSAGGSKNIAYEEEIAKLSPDVIVSTETDAGTNDELQEKTGVPVIVISQNDVFGEDTYQSLSMLGEVFGTKDHTDKVVSAMKEWQKDLNDRTKDIPDSSKPTCYSGAVSFKGPHGFEGTYAKYMPFVAVNAKNVVDETEQAGAMIIDLEKVAAWNPDYIFLNPQNMQLVNQGYEFNPDFYNNLKAVQNGNVYSQPSYNYNGTNLELAVADAYYAGKVIYPDQFTDVDMDEQADKIFQTLLGASYLQTLKDAGLGFNKLTIGA
ncbi:MAG: iron ABC transporter substrate-binding protein [Eggerthellaceae bacterium]